MMQHGNTADQDQYQKHHATGVGEGGYRLASTSDQADIVNQEPASTRKNITAVKLQPMWLIVSILVQAQADQDIFAVVSGVILSCREEDIIIDRNGQSIVFTRLHITVYRQIETQPATEVSWNDYILRHSSVRP